MTFTFILAFSAQGVEDGHGDLVHNDVGWMGPPGKDELLIWILSGT